GIDPQPINMVLTQPEQGTGDQEIAHLGASIVKDIGTPFFMFALARIGIFIQVCAIQITQGVAVFGEVRGYPVEHDSNTLLVKIIAGAAGALASMPRLAIDADECQ